MAARRAPVIAGIAALLAVACLPRILATGPSWLTGIDDANITFTYVRHFLAGHGLVFTPGGGAVEGFSSPLWFLLVTAGVWLTGLPPEHVAVVLSFLFSTALLYVIWRHTQRATASAARAWLYVAALLAIPGITDWLVLCRLETPLWTLLVVYATTLAVSPLAWRSNTLLCFCLAAMVWCRPEGLVLAPLLAVIGAIVQARTGKRAGARVPSVSLAAPLLVALGAAASLLAVRISIFDSPMPNTYYAKVSSSTPDNVADGMRYLYVTLRTGGWGWLAVTLAAWWPLRHRNARSITAACWVLIVGVLMAMPIAEGGDHFPYGRFFLPAIGVAWLGVWRTDARLMIALVAISQLNLAAFVHGNGTIGTRPLHAITQGLRQEYRIAESGREEAQALHTLFKGLPLPVWGVTAAGGTSYAYNGMCFDLLGLNDREMARSSARKSGRIRAHASFDVAVFLRRTPDVFYVTGARTDSQALAIRNTDWAPEYGAQSIMLKNLIRNPQVASQYSFCRLSANGATLYAYVHDRLRLRYPAMIAVLPS